MFRILSFVLRISFGFRYSDFGFSAFILLPSSFILFFAPGCGVAGYATKMMGQYFPYSVRDVYGSAVIPENIGNIEPEPFNNHPARLPADLIATAKANLVVRDGTASFFYHPYLGTDALKQTVEGIQGLGYTFVAGSALLN